MTLSPVLNTYQENASPKTQLLVLIGFFSTESIYGWLTNTGSFDIGYSIISFIGLYLLARFVKSHAIILTTLNVHTDLIIYSVLTIIPALVSFLGIRNNLPQFHPIYYSSPFVIAASLFLLLGFSRLSFSSKSVNWIACSVFSVYIIHLHPIVLPYFVGGMNYLASSLHTISYTMVAIIVSITLVVTCSCADKIRIKCWEMICYSFLDKWLISIESLYDRFYSRLE